MIKTTSRIKVKKMPYMDAAERKYLQEIINTSGAPDAIKEFKSMFPKHKADAKNVIDINAVAQRVQMKK